MRGRPSIVAGGNRNQHVVAQADRQEILDVEPVGCGRVMVAEEKLGLALQHAALAALHVVGDEPHRAGFQLRLDLAQPVWKEGKGKRMGRGEAQRQAGAAGIQSTEERTVGEEEVRKCESWEVPYP